METAFLARDMQKKADLIIFISLDRHVSVVIIVVNFDAMFLSECFIRNFVTNNAESMV